MAFQFLTFGYFLRTILLPDLLRGIIPPLRMRLNSLELISVTLDRLSKDINFPRSNFL